MTASVPQWGRRSRMRFPVALPVEYALNGSRRRSVTRNLSSGGIFITGEALPLGQPIRLSIDWPVPLDTHCRLRLVIIARVIRRDTSGSAVRILKYDFHVRPSSSAASS